MRYLKQYAQVVKAHPWKVIRDCRLRLVLEVLVLILHTYKIRHIACHLGDQSLSAFLLPLMISLHMLSVSVLPLVSHIYLGNTFTHRNFLYPCRAVSPLVVVFKLDGGTLCRGSGTKSLHTEPHQTL